MEPAEQLCSLFISGEASLGLRAKVNHGKVSVNRAKRCMSRAWMLVAVSASAHHPVCCLSGVSVDCAKLKFQTIGLRMK